MKKLVKYSITLAVIALIGFACSDDYLIDGGVSKAETELTVYDYLEANNYSMFDTLLQIIDSLDLKESINSAGTFFAPTNYSIDLYLDQMTDTLRKKTEVSDTTYTLSHLFKDIQKEDILQYVIDEPVTLEHATINGEEFTTQGNTNITVKKIVTTDDQYYKFSDTPVYFLYYCIEGKEEERCQTQGILTQNGNGAVLNVLNNEHVFCFFTDETED